MGTGFLSELMKCSKIECQEGCTPWEDLKTIELYTLNG